MWYTLKKQIEIRGWLSKMTEKLNIKLDSSLKGNILDLGGGGECIIGQIYREQAIAIDNSQEELDEAPDVCTKMLMDATALHFGACEFDHVTAFYSLMYMTKEEQRNAIKEAYRVLKLNGEFHIWDTVIPNAYPAPFTVCLDIDANGTMVHTTYGIVKADGQDMELFIDMCRDVGMTLSEMDENNQHFYLQFSKNA